MIGAQVCQRAIQRFLTSEDEDPMKDDASNVVASLAHSLIPCASEASREAAIAAVADIVLAPDAMFSTDASRDARCDLATALVEHLDKATLAPLAKGLVGALVEPCLRGRAPGRPRQGPLPGWGQGRVLHPPNLRVGRLESPTDEIAG